MLSDYQPDQQIVYDPSGNRISQQVDGSTEVWTHAAANRLISDGSATFEYDAEGNRIRQTDGTTTLDYSWDHRNRLVSVVRRDAVSGDVILSVFYTYDVNNRRTGRTVTDAAGAETSRQFFVWDGDHVTAELDETGTPTATRLYGPDVDQLFASEDALGEVLWALTDNQNTVRDIATYDSAADTTSVVAHREYDIWGNLLAVSGTSVATSELLSAGYTGRTWDAEANLYYYRARWYDPIAGRFLSEDPLGFAAGDTNVQRYVGNGVPNATDPSGLQEDHDWERRAALMQQISSSGELALWDSAYREHFLRLHFAWAQTNYNGTAELNALYAFYESDQEAINRLYGEFLSGLLNAPSPPQDDEVVAQAPPLTAEEASALLNLGLILIDIAGIFDPTVASDWTAAAAEFAQGNWFGGGISAVAAFPWIGDTAKLAKLSLYKKRVESALDLARRSERFKAMAKPILGRIRQAIDNSLSVLPARYRSDFARLRDQIDAIIGRPGRIDPKGVGNALDRLQEAKRQFQKNRDFRNWAHKDFMEDMKMGGGGRRNPDIPDSMIADAYEEWLQLGKPKM